MDALVKTTAVRAILSSSEAQSRVRAIENIARQCLTEFPSTGEWDGEARKVTSLVCWILRELGVVHEPCDDVRW